MLMISGCTPSKAPPHPSINTGGIPGTSSGKSINKGKTSLVESSFHDHRLMDEFEMATRMTKGRSSNELPEILQKLYERDNYVVAKSLRYTIGQETAPPSANMLKYIRQVVDEKLKLPNYSGVVFVDQNDSEETESLVFQTRNLASPVFFERSVPLGDSVAEATDEMPSDEIHIFILDIASYFIQSDDHLKDHVSDQCNFFLSQGWDKDNTWVGIMDYGDLFEEFAEDIKNSPGGGQLKTLLKDSATWTGMQNFMHEAVAGLERAIGYRFFEAIAIRDPQTGEYTYHHDNVVHYGIPVKK